MRSIAKVRVELSEDLKKFVEVTPYQPGNANTGCVLNYKHAVGYLAPLYSYYQTRTDVQSNLYQDRVGGSSTGAFTNEYIHQFANAQKDQTGHAPFFKDENGAFYIYMYEHQINEANISMQFHWTADALQKDPVYHTYTLHFADYEAATQAAKNKVGAANWKERPLTDEELQPYKFPVMRNHYYTYTITKLNPLELKYEVCDWITKPDIDIVFGEVGVSSITLDPTTLNLEVGPAAVDTTATLTATVLPSAATNKSLTWTSSNPDVATVSEDPVSRAAGNSTVTVKAIAPGEAIVTATANDGSGATASCAVTVKQPVTSITLTNASVEVNKTITLTPTILPENASDKTVTWESSNTGIATVSDGVVTGKAAGDVTITATANDGSGVTASCTVTVTKPVESISISPTPATVEVGKTVELTATITPSNATVREVTWSSNNGNATVSSGSVTVDAAGKATITVTGVTVGSATITATADGKSATCAVTVKPAFPDGALTGKFTVNSSGKQVYFSKGNLQAKYNGSRYTWGFAANQYDIIGNGPGNTTIKSNGANNTNAIVDLFCWSTSKTNFGINTSTKSDDYSGDFVDWGKNIGDGNTWRTLTNDEWYYLINTRVVRGRTGKNYSYSFVTYGGKNGIVLYPDNYTGNVLSGSVTTLPEGVVFFPTPGLRVGSSITANTVNSYCYYWSSTGNYSSAYYAWININKGTFQTNSTYRYNGMSVRLVTDVK